MTRPAATVSHASFVVFLALGAALIWGGCGGGGDREPAPATVAAVNRGVSLMGQYDYDGATKAFAVAAAESPHNATVQIDLAIARFNRANKDERDIEEATRLIDVVVQQHPDEVRAWYFKGIILQHLGKTDAALTCFRKVVEMRPDDGVAWYVLGLCQQRLNQDPQEALRRAIALRPYLVSAYYRLWQTLQAAGKSIEAAPYLEKFKSLRESTLAETIELPQYNQMGDLALVLPLETNAAKAGPANKYTAGAPRTIFSHAPGAAAPAYPSAAAHFGGAAFVDVKTGGAVRVLSAGGITVPPLTLGADPATPTQLWLGGVHVNAPVVWAVGDFDNDEIPDVFVVDADGNHLWHGAATGAYTDSTGKLAPPAAGGHTVAALWLDVDHDGDLDLLVCNAGAPNQLFRNNADGTFTDVAAGSAFAEPAGDSAMVLAGDIDGDRDIDLILLRTGAGAKVLLNDLSGKFHEGPPTPEIRGDLGGVLQDFNGDGVPDLVTLGGEPAALQLFLGDGHGQFRPVANALTPDSPLLPVGLRGFRVADVDLDGDLDIAAFDRTGHFLINDGTGHFTVRRDVWTPAPGAEIVAAELTDLSGDFVPDLLVLEHGASDRVVLVPGVLSDRSTALALSPTGVRSRDKRTRSPASGYGTLVAVRSGQHEQTLVDTGQAGGTNQSPRPLVFGLSGAPQADYVRLLWSDAVMQIEGSLPAGRIHAISETQRKVSSCPLLFTWNGQRYEFITDFAGVGGLGYFVGPGEYATPQPIDYVKIEPSQLRPRDGRYELRISEAMEESAYVDRLELLVVDHAANVRVFPDERLAVTGPAPTHELLAAEAPLYAERAIGPGGVDCTAALRHMDRQYAYAPETDRRFFGFCAPHTLDLDFGRQLAALPAGRRVFLFITGYLEYPYSQTTYAATQARVGWQPIQVERQGADGAWHTIVADAGALGGMSRTMTVDLTGLLEPDCRRLRLTTNLELYYDEIFVSTIAPPDRIQVHALPVNTAELHPFGFAQEVSPDGRYPLVYDYNTTEPTAPFHTLQGAYTRYGDVRELLTDFDDAFVILAPGDEIAASFDASAVPSVPPGDVRSFVLRSHAYCKDMDLYTATPQTLEPMPFRGMTKYPYAPAERPAETETQRHLRERYQTRIVE